MGGPCHGSFLLKSMSRTPRKIKIEIFMGNGTPLACSKLGGVPGIFILYLFVVKFSVISCLGKLSYEIGVCIEVYHSFVGESCIRECEVVYDGILIRSLLGFLHCSWYSFHAIDLIC